MRDDSLAYDLESLKIAAREARLQSNGRPKLSDSKANRTDIVHAGYRLLQCAAAAIIFAYHIAADMTKKLPGMWDLTFDLLYPTCFFASLILAITRMMHFIPNPNPIIPVTISITGWLAMLGGALVAMRHAETELDIEVLSDDEVASNPVFQHDLLLCSLSLVGSSVYLVHAWLCYECWQWEKKEKKLREAADAEAASAGSYSSAYESDSGMSSNNETERNYQTDSPGSPLPGTSGRQGKPRTSGNGKLSRGASRLFKKLRGMPKIMLEDTDPLETLNEIISRSVGAKQTKVEDEPVRLYCCCVDLGHMLKPENRRSVPVHEFQVVHVM